MRSASVRPRPARRANKCRDACARVPAKILIDKHMHYGHYVITTQHMLWHARAHVKTSSACILPRTRVQSAGACVPNCCILIIRIRTADTLHLLQAGALGCVCTYITNSHSCAGDRQARTRHHCRTPLCVQVRCANIDAMKMEIQKNKNLRINNILMHAPTVRGTRREIGEDKELGAPR